MNWTKDWNKYEGKVFIVQPDNTVIRGEVAMPDVKAVRVGIVRDDNGDLEWHHPAYVFPVTYEDEYELER
jgi:hypothetical protein